ncbi:Thiamine biosynthesis lipoprotein ApbE precursor [Lentilactobacillus parabuchneri]|nr:Thiamine biosynthesis lipoprotein ApbE precursor [Lentilactobacillus parabuchneri]ORN16796.1 Thiamine biosynthesis lipoprotein ApbE precursor [Lentilactobacillus parabuchneri]ORN18631.1 Thiamine biosynthesis lipoprotein ApbE precursor [Lentilactobacillus parabuchneri]ORN21741.1 Thiamine biosynthesis lipoprotein ApbE precursor [Lentilactobacillus parabuchneri]ORN28746.1 Thiamine biosynthesis lipoprotein ApbE precursor [Lentilactobacillus parabuchneri]
MTISNNQTAHKKYVSKFSMMGTIISLTLFEQNEAVVNGVYDYLVTMDKVFSANRSDSELSKINQNAGIKPVQVSQECFELIRDAIGYTKQFPESFNVLIGPVVKLWKIGFGGKKVPTDEEIKNRLKLVEPDNVILNPSQNSVFLQDTGMQLDLGAIAKGYFADRIIDQLKRNGIKSAIINLGGNVQILGENPTSVDQKWNIGIRNPNFEDGRSLAIVHTSPQTFVTSGVRERYFRVNGKTYHHILSPQTGYPVKNDIVQVSIITDNSELAEVYSTVCFFRGIQAGKRLIESTSNIEGIFVNERNEITVTEGIKDLGEGVYLHD